MSWPNVDMIYLRGEPVKVELKESFRGEPIFWCKYGFFHTARCIYRDKLSKSRRDVIDWQEYLACLEEDFC